MDQELPNPTPEDGGASTLDRLERYLAADDTPDQPKPEATSAEPAASESVETDGDGAEQAAEPQVTTSDLAKYLGIDEAALDLDEDGTVKLKTKVDGVEGAAKLADLLKSYQLQEHVDRKAREAAEREKALHARAQEVEQHVSQRLQYAEGLTNIAAQELLREYQSIDWNSLEQSDPGHAALLKQKFQERQAQLRGVLHNIEAHRAQMQQRGSQERQQVLAREAERLPTLIPEWKDHAVANKERQEIRDWAVKAGFEPQEIDGFSLAHHVAVMRKAMMFDKLQQSKPAIENKVRLAPKLVKPGQSPNDQGPGQKLRNIRQTIQKSGGKRGIEDYLLQSGKV